MLKKIITLIFLIYSPVVFAHGGEDHVHEEDKNKQVISSENIITRVYKNDDKEILIKYNKLIENKNSNIDLFITDKNNNGQKINNMSIIFQKKEQKETLKLEKTSTIGWYKSQINLKNFGSYETNLTIDDKKLDLGTFEIEKINEIESRIENYSIKTSLILLIIFLSLFALFIFFNPLKKEKINEV